MARVERLIDDVDGSEDDVQGVRFSIGADVYEIELSAKNREKLLGPLLKYARPLGAPAMPSPPAIRAWAARNGIEVPSRGSIPQAVREAYEKAHGG